MRVVNQAIDDTLAERKDKLKQGATWQGIIERGIQACEAETDNGGHLVPLTMRRSSIVPPELLGKVYHVAMELARWIVWVIDREDERPKDVANSKE